MPHLAFESQGKNQQGTYFYLVKNTDEGYYIGKVWFSLELNKYNWEQDDGVLMSKECLNEVSEFINTL